MTQPCRPMATVRFMHTSEPSSKQLMYGMAHRALIRSCFYLAERFTPERPNTIHLFVYRRTIQTFFLSRRKVEMLVLPTAARMPIPAYECGGLSPRSGEEACTFGSTWTG